MSAVKYQLVFFFSLLFSAEAIAADMVYEEPLEGVYSQFWHADFADRLGAGGAHIYVRGEGKLGDFIGVLYLDCEQPRFSRWEASDGNLTTQQVPAEVIQVIRLKYC